MTKSWAGPGVLTSTKLMVLLAGLWSGCALSQTAALPALKMVVPVTAGGSMDAASRLVARRLALRLERPVVIDNKPGAQQGVGTEYVIRSAPDGNTLLVVGASVFINPSLSKLNYQALTDLAPVSGMIKTRMVLVARKGLAVRSLDDFLTQIKSQQKPMSCAASPGPGLLACEQLRTMIRQDLVVVPFNGLAPAATAIFGGHVDLAFVPTEMILSEPDGERWKALAMADSLPVLAPLPSLPALSTRLPGFEIGGMYGFMAPAKTPKAQIDQLSKAIAEVLAEPEVETYFTRQGDAMLRLGPEEFGRFLRTETERISVLIKNAGIK